MGSGIIFVVIIGMWAVVLVPMWLRNHDAASETRSVDRFSTAMRILRRDSSSQTAPGTRDVLMPRRARTVELSGGRAPAAAARRTRAAERKRMRLRRTLVVALLSLLAVTLAAAAVGVAPLWLPVAALLGTAGYAVYLRNQMLRATREARRRERSARPARPARPAQPSVPVPPTWPVTAETRRVAPVAVTAARTEAPVVLELDDDAWAPTPVVLPTYVTAPPATSVPRVIDLTHPGSWSAAHMLDQAASQAPDPDEIFDGRAAAEAREAELAAQHETVAATVAGSTAQPFLDDDLVFDQDDEALLAFLDRRAVND